MTTIEAEARHARPDEQERLARFTGFGASDLADRIFRRAGDAFAPAWEDLGVELEGLVSRDDLANLKRATQYAHYTPEFMIRAIWRALRRMGFDGGRVLEPGCGTGLFFALCPEALAGKLALTGVEMDPTTARIAKLLYPNARIRHEDFTKARLPELYDLAIGNPPFSDRTVRADDPAGELRLSLHDYFIARSVERLRPGGLAAFVTSRWTMDKVDGKARQHIAAMADLIGAVRLPEGAMHDRAGTEVVVDILFLQKRDAGTAPAGAAWDVLAEAVPAEDGETALSINRYFVEHPEMALGTHARTSSAYGPVYTLKPVLSTPGALSDLLAQALDRLPRDLFKAAEVEATSRRFHATVRVGTAAEGAAIKEGSYLVHEGALVQIIGGEPQAVAVRDGKGTEGIPAKHARIIRSLIAVRDAVREVLRTQANDEPWGSAQIRLRSAYALFVRNFGPINLTTISETVTAEGETRETFRRPNLQPFLDDPDVWLVASIEDYDLESGTAKHGPIFRERVLHPETTPVIETAEDALAVTLHETGLVDLDRIAELLGRSRETAIAELGNRIFLDPEADGRHEPRRLGHGRRLSLGQDPRQAHGRPGRRGARPALSAQCRGARKDPARGPQALRHHRAPRRAVDTGRCRCRLRGRGPWRQNAGLSHGRDRQLVDQRPCLRWPGELLDRLGHIPSPCRRTLDGRPQRLAAADLRRVRGGRGQETGPQRRRHRSRQGQAHENQGGVRDLGVEGRRTRRPAGADLQRPLQQPRPPALRRVASDDSRRLQRHQLLRPPEAGDLADRRFRHDLCRPRGRSGKDLLARRRDHGAEAARVSSPRR